MGLSDFGRNLSAFGGSVKITVKTHNGKTVFLGGAVLVGIIEIQVELFHHSNHPVDIFRLKMNKRNGPFYEGILDEAQEPILAPQFAQNNTNRMKSEIRDE